MSDTVQVVAQCRPDMLPFAGLDFGASAVKAAAVSADLSVWRTWTRAHRGDAQAAAAGLLEEIDPTGVCRWAVTGREGAGVQRGVRVPAFEALAAGLRLLSVRAEAVAALGAETLAVYPLAADGRVTDVVSGNRCAAGSLGMFAEQLARMGVTVEEAEAVGRTGRVVALARRCSVHRKSDCTHALNTRRYGVPDLVRTLCHGLAEEVAALVAAGGIRSGALALCGGGAANGLLTDSLRGLLPADFEVVVAPHARCLEALGAAALAKTCGRPGPPRVRSRPLHRVLSFSRLPPLEGAASRLIVEESRRGALRAGGRYILGVDGGSTTTKAALIDAENRTLCAAHYTRTLGDPGAALRRCVRALRDEWTRRQGPAEVQIDGVATTGSAGEALALLCGTPWHHNEIVAHAQAAARLHPGADTVLEIGGQDAKFIRLRDGLPVDFAMNGACAAGTGSFIEEAARAELGVEMEDIEELALRSRTPLRFSDQCAAFAASDIRKAIQEGASREDVLAGLAYAVADNYLTKVVGHRAMGEHVLFQGGASRNRAIALALAARTGRRLIVPPEPELMGCYGIALWLAAKTERALWGRTSLDGILGSELRDVGEFTCAACANACRIRKVEAAGRITPFGGRCFRWSPSSRRAGGDEEAGRDYVAVRNRMIFGAAEASEPGATQSRADRPVVGMIATFTASSLYPLYATFLRALGHTVVLARAAEAGTPCACPSNRCRPYELAYGMLEQLLRRGVSRVLLPHVVAESPGLRGPAGFVCPIAQGSPHYLREAAAGRAVILAPVLDMRRGTAAMKAAFEQLGRDLNHPRNESAAAFSTAWAAQARVEASLREEGARALADLRRRGGIGMVVVGRPYNAFSELTNMGIPRRIASAGAVALPCDMLPWEEESGRDPEMHWSEGRVILASLRYVRRHPQLFPVYVGNFGCGPDAFILHEAAEIMGDKPWLYFELDSHAVDSGVGTRIAAFLDIIGSVRPAAVSPPSPVSMPDTRPVATRGLKPWHVVTLRGECVSLRDPRVTLAYPSMGTEYAQAMAAVSRRFGVRALALPPAGERTLAAGRELTSGRECLPATLTVGALTEYLQTRFRAERSDEILVYFMPTVHDPCRFSQYNVFIRRTLRRAGALDTALWSPSAEDGYRALGFPFLRAAWQAVTVAALMREIRPVLKTVARDRDAALRLLDAEWSALVEAFSRGTRATWAALRRCGERLQSIERQAPVACVPKVLLVGEIFARFDDLCGRGIEDLYASRGIAVIPPPVLEWLYYTEWCALNRVADGGGYRAPSMAAQGARRPARPGGFSALRGRLRLAGEARMERRARRLLAPSGLLATRQEDIDAVVRRGARYLHPALTGEAILTVGSAVDVLDFPGRENWLGLILIGPFNCMPAGVAESLLKPLARRRGVPWLTLECDGTPWPSNTLRQIEVHIRRVKDYAGE